MDLYGLLFPAPEFNKKYFVDEGDLIRITVKASQTAIKPRTIPCILLKSSISKTSLNYLIVFHGNAEDIYATKDLGNRLRESLHVHL